MKTTMIGTTRTVVVLACLLVAFSARSASAQVKFGGRLGVSGDPNQFYIGPHFDFGQVVPPLVFRPNIEAGFGSGGQLVDFNFEFLYRVKLTGNSRNAPWQPYVVGGPAAGWAHSSAGGNDTSGAFNFGMGLENSKGIFGEIKFGIHYAPSIKLGIGYTFK